MSEEKVSMDLHGYLVVRDPEGDEERWRELLDKLYDARGCAGADDHPPEGIYGELPELGELEGSVFFFILEEMRDAAMRIAEEYDDVVLAEGVSDEPIRFDFGGED